MTQEKLSINGMNCMNCVGKIQKGVSSLPGAENVVVNLKGKYMTLDLNEELTTKAAVKETVESLGFQVVEKKPGLLGKLLGK